jgi:hypothetical protein
MHYLTGIYWIKNEAPYLPEWIEFHILQGFDHFIFYDNRSTDNLYEILAPYLEAKIVEIRKYPKILFPPARSGPRGSKNFWVMDFCIREQRNKSKWVHFHAIDEFTFGFNQERVADILRDFENFGGLSIEWEIINSSGHNRKPAGLVIENYLKTTADPERHVKTIIQPNLAISTIGNPHNFRFKKGFYAVDELFSRLDGPFRIDRPSSRRIHNHHYVTRSREEFISKSDKGLLDSKLEESTSRSEPEKIWKYWHTCGVQGKCVELVQFAAIVKSSLKARYKGRETLVSHLL